MTINSFVIFVVAIEIEYFWKITLQTNYRPVFFPTDSGVAVHWRHRGAPEPLLLNGEAVSPLVNSSYSHFFTDKTEFNYTFRNVTKLYKRPDPSSFTFVSDSHCSGRQLALLS